MERETIQLTYEQHKSVCQEGLYADDNGEYRFTEVEDIHEDSRRHTECYHKILRRDSDGKYFGTGYEVSAKDSMGWYECNYYVEHSLTEVFPQVIQKTVYR